MDHRAFWLPKRGNRPDECEDAWSANSMRGRFAVADGAAESAFARSWAQCLVDRFKDASGTGESWVDALPAIQSQWAAAFHGQQLPWYAEAKLQQGAFATFLGLIVGAEGSTARWWEAIAVGDSCLFQTRGAKLMAAFPLTAAEQFSNSPHLLGSRTPVTEIRTRRLRTTRGVGQANDRFWLMTDALAQWWLAEHQAARRPWESLEPLLLPADAEEDFAAWIEDLRDRQQIRNDDVTLLAIWL